MKNLLIFLSLSPFFTPTITTSQVLPPKEDRLPIQQGNPWQTDDVIWTALESAPQEFCRAGSAVLGNYLYIFGSMLGNIAYAFNLITEEWEESTPALYGNFNWCAVATDEHIYLVGRYFSATYGCEFQRFTPQGTGPTGSWELMADYPIAACGIAAAWDGGNYIYACGGGGNSGPSFLAHRYDIADDTWESICNLPMTMKYHGGAFIEGKFHVVGGYQTSNEHYAYDPDEGLWIEKTEPLVEQNFGLFNLTDNGINIITVAGLPGYSPTNQVQYYDPFTDSWTMESVYPLVLYLNSVEYIGDGIVISAGGYDNYGNIYDEVYKGEGFPTGIFPAVEIDLTPYNTPIQIPPDGGAFDFNIEITNNDLSVMEFDCWIIAILPDGREYGPIINTNLTFNPAQTVNRDRSQVVPSNAPPGEYTYRAYIGVYPDDIWNADEFGFEKLESESVSH